MRGRPNVVSMEKLLNYLLRRWIDSYYLLIVKFDISKRSEITHRTYFFDLLDWTDFVTYDAGPGQIMLKEQDFYDAHDSGSAPPGLSMHEKTACLFALFEQRVEALFKNRRMRLRRSARNLKDSTTRASAWISRICGSCRETAKTRAGAQATAGPVHDSRTPRKGRRVRP